MLDVEDVTVLEVVVLEDEVTEVVVLVLVALVLVVPVLVVLVLEVLEVVVLVCTPGRAINELRRDPAEKVKPGAQTSLNKSSCFAATIEALGL